MINTFYTLLILGKAKCNTPRAETCDDSNTISFPTQHFGENLQFSINLR